MRRGGLRRQPVSPELLASSLNVSETLAGERRSVTPASIAAVGIHGIPRREADSHERIVPGIGEGDVGIRLWRGAATSVDLCFTAFGVGPLVFVRGNMYTEAYCNVLDNEMLPTLWRFYGMDPCYSQDDNARCHVSRATMQWYADNNVRRLDWPAQSPDLMDLGGTQEMARCDVGEAAGDSHPLPDLNPIEHLRDELDRQLRARQAQPKSIAQLMEWLQEEWRRIPVDVLQSLVESMPDRVAVVIAARGGTTRFERDIRTLFFIRTTPTSPLRDDMATCTHAKLSPLHIISTSSSLYDSFILRSPRSSELLAAPLAAVVGTTSDPRQLRLFCPTIGRRSSKRQRHVGGLVPDLHTGDASLISKREAHLPASLNIEFLIAYEDEARLVWSSAGMQGWVNREIPEKTRRPAASTGMIITYENPGATPRIEPDSPGEVSMEQRRNKGTGGKREIPEKTRLPAVSSGTISTCENPGATPPGNEPGSPRWEASGLTTTSPRPH
ncbi:hypothetical protein PR048_023961 [Dryococelus australis]|uniref:Transposase n=1 Tax=Dryococelus australis TaxID=614101 RepID=A0ABQ9GVM5_9NEOP|nr:hypothetical protein PR048_023961 [Dryococelus australis]